MAGSREEGGGEVWSEKMDKGGEKPVGRQQTATKCIRAAERTTVDTFIVLLVCVSPSPCRLGGVCSVTVNIDICDTVVRSSIVV